MQSGRRIEITPGFADDKAETTQQVQRAIVPRIDLLLEPGN